MPVPGTITPEPEPFEQVTDAQAPSASITDRWVVEPSRAVDPLGRLLDRVLGEEALQVALGVEAHQELLGARLVRLLHDLDDGVRIAGPRPRRSSRSSE